MRALIVLLSFSGLCASCIDSSTYLKNEKTGQVVKCDGSHAVTVVEGAVQKCEALCIQGYKDQGLVRVPGPK